MRRIYEEAPAPVLPRLALRPSEAAKALGISEKFLWSLTSKGSLPCVRIGSRVTYFVHHIQRWADSQLAEQTGAGGEVSTNA